MRNRIIIGSLAVLLLAPFGLRAAGNYENGANLSDGCASCHGVKGQGNFETPPLAGLGEGYILKRLKAYRSGKEKSMDGIMHTYTQDFTDQQLADLAVYWGSFKKQ